MDRLPPHRFLSRLEEQVHAGFRQVLLYGHVEDEYYLSEPEKTFLDLHRSLLWYFLTRAAPSPATPLILFYGGQNKDRNRSLYSLRPVFADGLFPSPYPGSQWPSGTAMQSRAAGIVGQQIANDTGNSFAEYLSLEEWLSAIYALLRQDNTPVFVVFENVETYWRRPDVNQERHNDFDNYLSLYRQLLRREDCPHLVLLTSTVQDTSVFHLAPDQMGRIFIPYPTPREAETIYSREDSALGEKDELIREFCTLPLRRTRAIYRKYRETNPTAPMTLWRFRQYARGLDENAWEACLQDKKLEDIGDRIIGQDRALRQLGRFFNEVRQEIAYRRRSGRSNRRLLGFRVLAGPTGVGKTEFFRQFSLVCATHGIPSRIFNCTEYTESHSVSRFTGSPPGYAGSSEGELGRHLLENPVSILLFDEWEKAHLNVQLVFLKILEGELTLGSGQQVDLSDVLIFFTSNAGAAFLRPLPEDIPENQRHTLEQENLNTVLSALRNRGVPPELEGRLRGGITVFDLLTDTDARTIVGKKLEALTGEFETSHACRVRLNGSVTGFLLNRFQLERRSGARAIEKSINALRGAIIAELDEERREKLTVWYGQGDEAVFIDPGKAIYRQKDLSDLWRYALENCLHQDDTGETPLASAFQGLVGQTHVKELIQRRLESALHKPVTNGRAPLFFVFGGPTGVGKTETFQILSDLLSRYYIKKCPIVFSMTEYLNESDKNKLIGSPPGYAGSDTGFLGEFLLNNSHAVICFDEFEKCHISIKLLFLKLLEGELLLGSGDRVDLSHVLFIFTTNAGNRNFEPHRGKEDASLAQNTAAIIESLKSDYAVPDELIGRIKAHIIPFNPIGEAEAREIIGRGLEAYDERYEIHESVSTFLLDGFRRQPDYGARDLVNNIDSLLGHVATGPSTDEQRVRLWIDKEGRLNAGSPVGDAYTRVPLYSPEEEYRIGVHEAGHALCAATLLGADRVGDISISTAMKNDAPGVTRLNPQSGLLTRDTLSSQICILLGGRMAESICFSGNTSVGCSHDLTEANKRARAMVCELGMTANTDLPPIEVKALADGHIPTEYYGEILRILSEADARAREIIEFRRVLLDQIATVLVKDGVLSGGGFVELWHQPS